MDCRNSIMNGRPHYKKLPPALPKSARRAACLWFEFASCGAVEHLYVYVFAALLYQRSTARHLSVCGQSELISVVIITARTIKTTIARQTMRRINSARERPPRGEEKNPKVTYPTAATADGINSQGIFAATVATAKANVTIRQATAHQ